jgi:hypothetical protein
MRNYILKQFYSLYWMIIPTKEVPKLRSKGTVISDNSEKIIKILDNPIFDYFWEQSTYKANLTSTGIKSIREGQSCVLFLCDVDFIELQKEIYVHLLIYKDQIMEEKIGKVLSL